MAKSADSNIFHEIERHEIVLNKEGKVKTLKMFPGISTSDVIKNLD